MIFCSLWREFLGVRDGTVLVLLLFAFLER